MNSPIISVIVPIYNGALWLPETLESFFRQSFQDFEIILIDDASTDNLKSVLEKINCERLSVLQLEVNSGVANARNRGLAVAKGKYVAFCDADDICQPERLAIQLDFMEKNPDVGICGTAFTCFDEQDREMVQNPTTNLAIRRRLMSRNCFGMSTVMGRTELLLRYGFDQQMVPSEDYDLWTRLASDCVGMANLPINLMRYRVHSQQASQTRSAKLDLLARKIRAVYCAKLLGEPELLGRIFSEVVEIEDLRLTKDFIIEYCALHEEVDHSDFRFLLAWLYQKLSVHGIFQWRCWTRIQKELNLDLNFNYRLNIALLALLPPKVGRYYFDTLIKLKY